MWNSKVGNTQNLQFCETVVSCNVKQTPLEDNTMNYVVLCLSMWSSNCSEYIAEAHRILEDNGVNSM